MSETARKKTERQVLMIDLKKRKIGYKEFVAAEALLAAAAVLIGTYSHRELTGRYTESAKAGEVRVETAGTGVTNAEKDSEISSEIAAEPEPAENDGSRSAAYAKVQEDGETATGTVLSFTDSKYWGKEMILINPWHLLPEDYEADLEYVEYGHRMDACAAEHLSDMLSDCRDEGCSPLICSSYRERSKQERLFNSDVRKFMYSGMSEEEAIEETARNVAVPGSSEHEAGLAADIVYSGRQILDESQEDNDTQQWLMEHCWEYGFILRYPKDKQEITGITYEPWHYRYVGTEAAEYIMTNGLCLEEYLGVVDAESEYEWPGEYEKEEDEAEDGSGEESG